MSSGKIAALCALVIGIGATNAFAEYPERPVNMIIPFSAGGATDISARAISAPLGNAVGQPLVMTNVTGAGGATGSVVVKNAAADGYTMLFARVGSHTVSPAMKATLPYTLEDFRFVTVYEINPVACAVRAGSGIETIDDLVAAAKAGEASYSSSGVGTLLHLAAVMVLNEFDVEDAATTVTHIPQKGGGEAATAVLNGTVNFICTNTSALANFVANGQLKPLLVTTPTPVAGFDAPTAAELGKPDLEKLVGWTGIAGPSALSDDIAAKWGGWIKTAIQDEKFRTTMEGLGSILADMTPEESSTFIYNQYEAFRQLVDELGMRVEG